MHFLLLRYDALGKSSAVMIMRLARKNIYSVVGAYRQSIDTTLISVICPVPLFRQCGTYRIWREISSLLLCSFRATLIPNINHAESQVERSGVGFMCNTQFHSGIWRNSRMFRCLMPSQFISNSSGEAGR